MKKTSILMLTIAILTMVGSLSSCKKDLRTKTYALTAVNSSCLSGTVTFNETSDNKTSIVVNVSGLTVGKTYINHIHSGSVAAPGAVYISLTDIVATSTSATVTTVANFTYD